MTNDFLDEDYEVPASNSGYMKFQDGENRFRILSKPIIGWMYWTNDNRPVRIEGVKKPDVDPSLIKPEKDGKKDLKHFWAMIVWNNEKQEINILDITQVSVQKSISKYVKDEEWGSVYDYDLKITRSKVNGKTEYATIAMPKKKVASEAIVAFNERKIDLGALLLNKNPFQDIVNVTPLEMSL